MAIFKYDKEKGKVVELKKPPVNIDDTRNHVNMRTTWSSQTQVEFSQTTIDEDIAQRNAR
tara:strand:+ start:1463 stop:1642 length:180 start_codon:yes stop_codon:yes gene_type:complete